MTRMRDDATVQNDLPPLLEVLRTISGLVAVLVLAVVLGSIVILGESEGRDWSPPATAASPDLTNNPRPYVFVSPPRQRLVVFYLVATPEQGQIADWGEQTSSTEAINGGYFTPTREYQILYAGTNEEQQLAGLAILERMTQLKDAGLVEVIDLRSVLAGDM